LLWLFYFFMSKFINRIGYKEVYQNKNSTRDPECNLDGIINRALFRGDRSEMLRACKVKYKCGQ